MNNNASPRVSYFATNPLFNSCFLQPTLSGDGWRLAGQMRMVDASNSGTGSPRPAYARYRFGRAIAGPAPSRL